jgi:c-di-GMP-binding flagellar brake protein YcgR
MSDIAGSRPPESAQADLTVVARGLTVTARVERSSDSMLVVHPQGAIAALEPWVKRGARVEVFWVGDQEELSLPARIEDFEAGDQPRWHLTPTGPAERSQRRKAVRAHLELPVVIPWLDGLMSGTTVDLSEAGMRALVDGWGLPPEPGVRLGLTLTLGKGLLDLHGTVVWQASHGPQWLLAVHFNDLPERDSDRLRRHVFEALRAERARAMA